MSGVPEHEAADDEVARAAQARRRRRPEVEEPDEVTEPELEDPDAEEPTWPVHPWVVNGLIGLGVVTFIVVNVAAWQWVVGTPEAKEKGDWQQLRSIKGSVTGFVTFLLGGFLGFTAQRRSTDRAKRKARKNQETAQAQHATARRNRDAARRNREAAEERSERLRAIHQRTLRTLSAVETDQRRANLLLADGQDLEFRSGEVLNLTGVDSGRVLVGPTDDDLRRELLAIAELAGEP